MRFAWLFLLFSIPSAFTQDEFLEANGGFFVGVQSNYRSQGQENDRKAYYYDQKLGIGYNFKKKITFGFNFGIVLSDSRTTSYDHTPAAYSLDISVSPYLFSFGDETNPTYITGDILYSKISYSHLAIDEGYGETWNVTTKKLGVSVFKPLIIFEGVAIIPRGQVQFVSTSIETGDDTNNINPMHGIECGINLGIRFKIFSRLDIGLRPRIVININNANMSSGAIATYGMDLTLALSMK